MKRTTFAVVLLVLASCNAYDYSGERELVSQAGQCTIVIRHKPGSPGGDSVLGTFSRCNKELPRLKRGYSYMLRGRSGDTIFFTMTPTPVAKAISDSPQ